MEMEEIDYCEHDSLEDVLEKDTLEESLEREEGEREEGESKGEGEREGERERKEESFQSKENYEGEEEYYEGEEEEEEEGLIAENREERKKKEAKFFRFDTGGFGEQMYGSSFSQKKKTRKRERKKKKEPKKTNEIIIQKEKKIRSIFLFREETGCFQQGSFSLSLSQERELSSLFLDHFSQKEFEDSLSLINSTLQTLPSMWFGYGPCLFFSLFLFILFLGYVVHISISPDLLALALYLSLIFLYLTILGFLYYFWKESKLDDVLVRISSDLHVVWRRGKGSRHDQIEIILPFQEGEESEKEEEEENEKEENENEKEKEKEEEGEEEKDQEKGPSVDGDIEVKLE